MTGSAPRGEPRLSRRTVLAAGAATSVAMSIGLSISHALAVTGDATTGGHSDAIAVGAGRSVVSIVVPARRFASVGVFGPAASLRGASVVGTTRGARAARAAAPIDEDGLLPRIVSFAPEDEAFRVDLVIDVEDPVTIELAVADPGETQAPTPKAIDRGDARARPLIGLPPPASAEDGYVLGTPARYAFVRVDVAHVLLESLRKTRKRFRGDPIALSDASQWDGRRPKTDRNAPRHISHVGGRDVDIALPASDGTQSLVQDRCRGVLLAQDRYGCAPGTVKGFDAQRMAMLVGTMCDLAPGEVVKVFMDDVYRREVVAVAPSLVEKKWIKADAAAALSEDGIIVASPWHTDHVHVRFRGEEGRVGFSPNAR
jgi:hypothetical protein